MIKPANKKNHWISLKPFLLYGYLANWKDLPGLTRVKHRAHLYSPWLGTQTIHSGAINSMAPALCGDSWPSINHETRSLEDRCSIIQEDCSEEMPSSWFHIKTEACPRLSRKWRKLRKREAFQDNSVEWAPRSGQLECHFQISARCAKRPNWTE